MLYLTLRQYEYVAAVAQAGSLSAAAAQLNISQPSLSVALTQVEARLGQNLFIRRKGTPITLTAAGDSYVSQVEELLSLARRLEDPARMRKSMTGRLTLGLFEDLAPTYLCPLLEHLTESLAGVEFRYRIADFETLAREMLDGRIDVSVTYDLGLDGSFHKQALSRVTPCALVSDRDPLAARTSVSLMDLADRPLVLFEEGLSVRHVLGLFRKLGERPLVQHRVKSLEVMRSLAGRGPCVGISYSNPPHDRTYDGTRAVAIPIDDAIAAEPLVLVHSALVTPTAVQEQACAAVEAYFRESSE